MFFHFEQNGGSNFSTHILKKWFFLKKWFLKIRKLNSVYIRGEKIDLLKRIDRVLISRGEIRDNKYMVWIQFL